MVERNRHRPLGVGDLPPGRAPQGALLELAHRFGDLALFAGLRTRNLSHWRRSPNCSPALTLSAVVVPRRFPMPPACRSVSRLARKPSLPPAVAIALNQTGQSKPPSQRRRSSPNDRAGPAMGGRNGRLAREISRRVDEGQSRARR